MIIETLLFFLFGLILGSFLSSLIYRLYNDLSLWQRSFCPICKKKLKFQDLIPLLSFVVLKAKCRFCKEKISWQYFLLKWVQGFCLFWSF